MKKLVESEIIRWPVISLSNQQGRVDFENQVAQIASDGTVSYFERFTATFQAPDFDFRLFPLNHQRFFINVDSDFPVEDFVFKDLPGFSGISGGGAGTGGLVRVVAIIGNISAHY